jgi:hypothetical protein
VNNRKPAFSKKYYQVEVLMQHTTTVNHFDNESRNIVFFCCARELNKNNNENNNENIMTRKYTIQNIQNNKKRQIK